MTLNGHFALNSVLRRYFCSSEAWLWKLGYALKLVVNVVGELLTEKNSCGIARFPYFVVLKDYDHHLVDVCWRVGGGQFCPTSLGPDPTITLRHLADNWSASLMLSNRVTCDSTLRQIVYFRGAPDGTAFVGVWRQLAEDEYVLKHRIALPPATVGVHRVDVPDPLPVERGDFLGIHYPRDGGDGAAPSGGIVMHSVPADDVAVELKYFYQTLVVDAADEDFPTDRTIRLSSFQSRLESRTFALQAVLVPESLGPSSMFTV